MADHGWGWGIGAPDNSPGIGPRDVEVDGCLRGCPFAENRTRGASCVLLRRLVTKPPTDCPLRRGHTVHKRYVLKEDKAT